MSKYSKYINIVTGAFIATTVALSASADELKIGLLTGGSATESGWNKVAYDALLRTESELGAVISNVELDHNPASYEKAYLDYADQGYDIIIGHGFEFQDAALTVSADYPDITFLVSSSFAYEGNYVGVTLSAFQPFYMMGVIAGRNADKAGYIGGMEIPPIKIAHAAFEQGAKSVNPDFEVSAVYIGNFSDSGAAKEAAIAMIANGAEFIVPNADSAALGAIQAAREAGDHISVFGAYGDFTESAPKNILASYDPAFGQGLVDIAKAVRDGTFAPGGNIVFGMDNETVMRFIYNDNAAHPVSAELRAEVEAVKAKLISGEISPAE